MQLLKFWTFFTVFIFLTALCTAAVADIQQSDGKEASQTEGKQEGKKTKKKKEEKDTATDNKEYIIKKTDIKTDNFKKETVYILPEINYSNVPKKEKLNYFQDYKDPDFGLIKNPIIYQITASSLKGEKSFMLLCGFYADPKDSYTISEMYDSNGNAIGTSITFGFAYANTEIDVYQGIVKTKKAGPKYRINISEKYLEENKDSGIAIKAFSSKGDKYFHIPPYYIQAALEVTKQEN